jgi:hypothetical protein
MLQQQVISPDIWLQCSMLMLKGPNALKEYNVTTVQSIIITLLLNIEVHLPNDAASRASKMEFSEWFLLLYNHHLLMTLIPR